ncbi:MAG TPA: hypothetical protein VFR86_14570 [Burkholderiaceae bacterium]|nr:hypothetical protein [Burkholderiaceae bacterium]
MTGDRFYATRDFYQIPATIVVGGGGIALGRGVDMTDPQNPVLVPDLLRFFSEPMRLRAAAAEEKYEVSGDAIKDTFALLQSDTVESEAATLNTYFRASYALSSVEGAMELARSSRRESHSAYVLLTHRGDSRVMSPQLWQVREDLRPLAESLEDDEAAFNQFRRDFGTHYIHAVTYGLTIAIRGSLRSSNEDDRKKLGTRLKAGFGAFKGEGGVAGEMSKQLQSADLDLTSEVNCGGTEPARPLAMSSFAEIAGFLKDISAGKIRFKLAPVEIHLASYWSLLDPARLPRCRSLLDPLRYGPRFNPAAGSFGVPAGTIIAWRPTTAHIENADDPARAVIRPPQGWALCDGQDGRPDLRGRFIRGAARLGAIGETGGAESHNHQLQSGTVARVSGLVTAGTSAVVSAKSPGQTNLPPFVQMVYIIKLDETR